MDIKKKDSVILFHLPGHGQLIPEFPRGYHAHIYCHRGSISFIFKDRPYRCNSGEFVFWFADSNPERLVFSKNFKATVLLVEKDFLNKNIPDQSWSIDALLHSRENPVLHLKDKHDKERIMANFQLLHHKFLETGHLFYQEVLKLQMKIFIFEMWHTFANEYKHRKRTIESGTLYQRFMQLLPDHCMKEREVQFYAHLLNISAKYLNFVCKQNSGITASEWILRYVRERLIYLLQSRQLNISEIADEMNFSSRSFFTRYVRKALGVSPSEYRQRLTDSL